MTLDAARIAETVYAVERALELDDLDWIEGDVHWWPLYRIELYRRLFLQAVAEPAGGGAARSLLMRPGSRREFTPQAAGGVWLVSDGVSYTTLDDGVVERFCSPLAALCATLDVPATMIDRAMPRRPALPDDEARWWAPQVLRAKAAATLAARLSPDARHDRLVARVERVAAQLGCPLPRLPARRLDAMCRAVQGLAGWVERAMQQARPRAVFVVSFYDVAGYAFLLAAARLGIDSVDIQHGVAGTLHPAYACWQGVPSVGYRLLPRWFWGWTRNDVAAIEAWAGTTGGAHRALWGGHPFLEAWRDGLYRAGERSTAALQDLRRHAADATRVLVTLQPQLVSDEALGPLLGAMARRRDVAWWLRLHPAARSDRPRVEELLRSLDLPHGELEAASELPLPLLLSEAHWHATHSSSTVIEAQALGLPSIIWSRYGADLFADIVAGGGAQVACDGAAFAACLHTGRPIAAASESSGRQLNALRHILGSHHDRDRRLQDRESRVHH